MQPHPTDPAVNPPRPSRRWLWWVPAGCLFIVLLMAAAVFALVWMIGAAFDQSEAYQEPLRRAQASSEVRALLGEPVKAGWLPQGEMSVSGSEGTAQLTIPLHGPRGEAVIQVQAIKRDGTWVYSQMEVVAADGVRVDLRDGVER